MMEVHYPLHFQNRRNTSGVTHPPLIGNYYHRCFLVFKRPTISHSILVPQVIQFLALILSFPLLSSGSSVRRSGRHNARLATVGRSETTTCYRPHQRLKMCAER